MKELHVDDVQQLLVQLTDIDYVAGQEAGLGSAETKIERPACRRSHKCVRGNN